MGKWRLIGLLTVWLCTAPWAAADHITGGEMYYQYLGSQGGNHLYRVTLKLLMRCNSGRQFPNPIQFSVFQNGSNTRLQDFPVPIGNQTIINLNNSDPCISNPPDVCYDVATYSFDVQLAPSAQGYLVVAQVNFRVNGLANLLPGAGGIGATYTAEIPGSAAVDSAFVNNSAQFTGSDLVVVCANSPFTYSFAASDPDGDALRYTFCAAYQSGTSGGGMNSSPPVPPPYPFVPYRQGFDGSMPLGDKVTVNAVTGLVSGIAPGIGNYVITVCVDELRNGRVIASQRKDIQLNITGCTIAAALLAPSYQLCADENEVSIENLSQSPLIQAYAWRLTNRQGNTVVTSSDPRFTYRFTDTGLYRISLRTNPGLSCPDSTSAELRYYPGFKVAFVFDGLCFGGLTRFDDVSTTRYGSILRRNWQLGEVANPAHLSADKQPRIQYLSEGVKTVWLRVENTNGCVDSVSRQVAISKDPPLQMAFRDTLICPPDTLQLQVAGNGTFTWDAADGLVSGRQTATPRVAPLVTTWYRVTQQLDNCTGRDSVLIRVVNNVTLSAPADTTICLGDTIQFRVTGNALQYRWSPGVSLSGDRVVQPFAWPVERTQYTVTATISACQATRSFWVTPVPYPLADAGNDLAICANTSVQLQARHNGNRLEWSPSASLSNSSVANPVAAPLQTTAYTLRVYDNKGCPKPGVDVVNVTVEPAINLQGTQDTGIVVGQVLQLNATGAPRYQWYPAAGLSNAATGNPTFRSDRPADVIRYQVIGFNDAGCRDSLEVNIRVYANGPSIYVPTAFTPNGDGLNETLRPVLAGMQTMTFFRVFNRYGEMIFSSDNTREGWDGTIKGHKQPSGVFIWMVRAIDFEGKEVVAKGNTMLIR